MSTRLANIRLMPFATDSWSPEGIRLDRQARGGLEFDCAFPCVALDMASRTSLRLNNTRFDLEGMPDLTESSGSEAHFLRDVIKRQCRPWEPLAHRFVDGYFTALDHLLAAHAQTLGERLAPFAGLYDPAHWLFSAPRPFPRAHLFAPAGSPSDTLSPEDFVAVDFAFFLGPDLVAVLPEPSGLTPRKAQARAERLERAGVRIATFSNADLTDAPADLFCRALSPRLPTFWEADAVPMGPFRPAWIEE